MASLSSLTLPRQEISVKSLPDLLQTDTERVCGLKNSHKTNPLCNHFIRKHVRAGASQIRGSSINLLHDPPSSLVHPCQLPYMEPWAISMGYPWKCSWPLIGWFCIACTTDNKQVISTFNFGCPHLTLKQGPKVKSDHIRGWEIIKRLLYVHACACQFVRLSMRHIFT